MKTYKKREVHGVGPVPARWDGFCPFCKRGADAFGGELYCDCPGGVMGKRKDVDGQSLFAARLKSVELCIERISKPNDVFADFLAWREAVDQEHLLDTFDVCLAFAAGRGVSHEEALQLAEEARLREENKHIGEVP